MNKFEIILLGSAFVCAVASLVCYWRNKVVGFLGYAGLALLSMFLALFVGIYNDTSGSRSAKQSTNAVVAQKLLQGEAVSFEQFTDVGRLRESAVKELGLTISESRKIFIGTNVQLRLGYVPTNVITYK